MGLIKAAMGAAGGVMADQWKEFFYCDALIRIQLMIKGQKRTGARIFPIQKEVTTLLVTVPELQ